MKKLFTLSLMLGLFSMAGYAAEEEPSNIDKNKIERVIVLSGQLNDEILEKVESGEIQLEEVDMDSLSEHELQMLLDEMESRPPLSKRHGRLDNQATVQNQAFLKEVQEFLTVRFDPEDDQAEEEFNAQRLRIVKLLFRAPSERMYYQRLYLLNKIWLENQDEAARFESLDREIRDVWLQIESNRRRIQKWVTGASFVVGFAAGGFVVYKMTSSLAAVGKTGFAYLIRFAGRGTAMVIGGWVLGQLVKTGSFMALEAYYNNRIDYVDPIDGDEDLRDVLDLIEDLP